MVQVQTHGKVIACGLGHNQPDWMAQARENANRKHLVWREAQSDLGRWSG